MKNDPRDFYIIANNEFGEQIAKEVIDFINNGVDDVIAHVLIGPVTDENMISSLIISDGKSIMYVHPENILVLPRDDLDITWNLPAIERNEEGSAYFVHSLKKRRSENYFRFKTVL